MTTERDDPNAHPDEPGAYIGHEPERVADTIPGGVRRDDERIAAHSTQTGAIAPDDTEPPEGHRQGAPVTDDALREAGENH